MDTSIEESKKYFDHLMAGPKVDATIEKKLEWAGQCIDCAETLAFRNNVESSRVLLNKAESLLTEAQGTTLQKSVIANVLYYFLGGMWCGRVHLERLEKKDPYFTSSESVSRAIYFYRLCLSEDLKPLLEPRRHSETLTNLANMLNSAGRFIEAIETWKKSLRIDEANGMALANIGQGYYYYGNILQDRGHRMFLWKKGYESIKQGLLPEKQGVHPTALTHFTELLTFLEKAVGTMSLPEDLDKNILGEDEEELRYKTWVLKNTLFLNPLNDAYPNSISGRDVLSLPDTLVPLSEEKHTPWRHGLFDQLKQEFVSARFLFYEGTKSKHGHYSDRQVRMYNSLDYPAYGLGTEKLKAAYRGLFSILDKIAYFLNFYLGLNIPERDVYFSSFWYVDRQPRSSRVRADIIGYKNWPLTGLYWLSRDLALAEGQELLEPEMQDIGKIRNALEHKFLRLHTEGSGQNIYQETPLSVDLPRIAFEKKGRRLLKLVRAALIYLHGTVYTEESRKRKKAAENNELIPPIQMHTYEDSWKR